MKRSEVLALKIKDLEKKFAVQLKQYEKQHQALCEERMEAEVKEQMPKVPVFPTKVDRLTSRKRYQVFNNIVAYLRGKEKAQGYTPFTVYRDGTGKNISVKLADSYNQSRVPEKVRKQLRLLADRVSVSSYVSHMDDEACKVERYLFQR